MARSVRLPYDVATRLERYLRAALEALSQDVFAQLRDEHQGDDLTTELRHQILATQLREDAARRRRR